MTEGVEFDEEKKVYSNTPTPSGGASFARHQQQYLRDSPIDNEPAMIRWLIKHGYTSSPAFGRVILLIIVGVNALITYFVITHFL